MPRYPDCTDKSILIDATTLLGARIPRLQSTSGTSKLAIALHGKAKCTRIPRLCTRPLARARIRKPKVVELSSPCGATLCEVSGAALERPTSNIAMLCISSVLCCLRFLCCLRLSLPRAQKVTGILAHGIIDKPTLSRRVVQCLAQGTPQGMGAPGYPDCDPRSGCSRIPRL